MEHTLRGCNIAVIGDFGKARSHAVLASIIHFLGGKFSPKVSSNVTHLICSKDEWNKQGQAVTLAEQYSTIIISYDWLEDSLLQYERRSETRYMMKLLAYEHSLAKQQKRVSLKEQTKTEVQRFEYGRQQGEFDLGSMNLHFYRDLTAFIYNITLIRPHVSRNINERHQLRLYEQINGPPFYYASTATYLIPGQPPNTEILCNMGNQFHVAFASFRSFFATQTGIDWFFRPWGQLAQVSRKPGDKMPTGCEDGTRDREGGGENHFFSYFLPKSHEGEALGEVMWREGERRWGPPKNENIIGGGLVRVVETLEEEIEVTPKKRIRKKKENTGKVKKDEPTVRMQKYRPWPDKW